MMLRRVLLGFVVLLGAHFAEAFTFKGYLPLDGLLANTTVFASARVVLDHSSKYALIRQDGWFELFGVQEGTHVLTPLIPGYVFPSYLLTLTPTDTPPSASHDPSIPTPETPMTPHLQLLHPGKAPLPTSAASLPYPLVLRPLGREDYFTPNSSINILGLLKSPIVLMMLFSGAMMYGMPKLMASVEGDPELKKEMIEARKRMAGMQSGLSGSLSSMLTGSSDAADPPVTAAGRSGTPSRGNGGVQRRRGR